MYESDLSILIPTYNDVCYDLVANLSTQVITNKLNAEIIVMDDASANTSSIESNQAINHLPHARFIELKENLGRAKVRNKLADISNGRYILFIDSDAEVIDNHFLLNYMSVTPQYKVICGGIKTGNNSTAANCSLRLRYELKAEKIRTLKYRHRHPNDYLSTFNLLIEHDLFNVIHFSEQTEKYGYEDAMLGIELEKRGIVVHHIDNPLLHKGIDTNEQYLKKVEMALLSLYQLGPSMQQRANVSVLYGKIRSLHLGLAVHWLYCLLKSPLKKNLLSSRPSLLLLSFYKLGYYDYIVRKNKL